MSENILIYDFYDSPEIIKALNSPLRREMLNLLYQKEMNVNQVAEHLNIPQPTCTVNIQMLEKAGLIQTTQKPAVKGNQKICTTTCKQVVLTLQKEVVTDTEHIIEEMPIGLFFDYAVEPTCGLASETGFIGYNDHPESFINPHRSQAQLIWFGKGYLEYRLPLDSHVLPRLQSLAISAEVCSEFPQYNGNWPSDITLWINGKEAGTWTSPGDMGERRGYLNPAWWSEECSQYGFLKTWKVTPEGSYIDGVASTTVRLEDLDLLSGPGFVTVRIGIKENADNQGGLNLFGRHFGNYRQDLRMHIQLEPVRET